MIQAGLGLLPEPGKHELSLVQISQAESSLPLPLPPSFPASLPLSLSLTHTYTHFITQVRFTES